MKPIYDFCFLMRAPGRLSPLLYSWLWRFGLCGAFFSYIDSYFRLQLQSARFGDFIAFVLAAATIAQQWTVYNDIHFIEDSPELASRDYPAWLNMRLERAIRIAI